MSFRGSLKCLQALSSHKGGFQRDFKAPKELSLGISQGFLISLLSSLGTLGSRGVFCLQNINFWLRQELKESQSLYVRPSCSSLYRALNLHPSGSYLFQVSLMSFLGLRSLSSGISLKSVIALSLSSLTLLGQTEPKILRLVPSS